MPGLPGIRMLAQGWLVAAVLLSAGCAQNAYLLEAQVKKLQQEHSQLFVRNQELQTRSNTLDNDNQELETLLAQSRQQAQRAEEHMALLREQLRGAAGQLAQLMEERQLSEQRSQAMTASARRPGTATITANNSLSRNLPAIDLPGVEVRRDGDVIRVELPADRLFEAGSARIRTDAAGLLDRVTSELARLYPERMIGVEGHTDNEPAAGAVSQHQASVVRSLAVLDYIAIRRRLKPEQLFVLGHGGNHPVVSNATAAGKARNRRIELVVYPESLH